MNVKPITPDEVSDVKFQTFPDEVIECWNSIILKKWNPTSKVAYIRQEEIVQKLIEDVPGLARADVFSKNYLDIEELYRKQGWKVKYDKPHYTENYEAYFEFRK